MEDGNRSGRSKMRLFIGIFLPEEIKKEVEKIQKILQNLELFNGKFAEPENLHLTLKFLGEIKEEKLERIKKSLSEVGRESFSAKISKAGIFTPNRPRIVWLHLEKSERLQKQIDEAMEKEGLKKEERFMSHLTIARIKHITPISTKRLVEELKKISLKTKFEVKKFSLVKSVLTEKGPKYEIIKEFELL